MFNLYEMLTRTQQGLLIMVIGTVLLLHTLGIFERGLDMIIIGTAILMIIHGGLKANVVGMTTNLVRKFKNKEK